MYAVSWIACVGSGMAQARCRRYDVAPHLRPSGLVASTALHSCPSILARFQSPRQFFACEIHRKGPVCPFGKAKPRSQCYREAVQPRTSQRGGPPSFASLNLPRVANCGNSVRRQTTHPSRSAERHSDTAKQRSSTRKLFLASSPRCGVLSIANQPVQSRSRPRRRRK